MPFRAGNDARELFLFAVYSRGDGNVPKWYPGFVYMGPLPGQPAWMINLDFAFWANLLYIAGSIVYVFQALYWVHSWSLSQYDDDYNPMNPSNYLNLAGSTLFIANALASFLDWWLCTRNASFMNAVLEEDALGTPQRFPQPSPQTAGDGDDIPPPLSTSLLTSVNDNDNNNENKTSPALLIQNMNKRLLDLYWYNNLLFLVAAVLFQIDGVWMYDSSLDTRGCMHSMCGDFTLPFVANLLYLLSSFCSVLEYFENNRLRTAACLPLPSMFVCDPWQVDWFGWGDWTYVLAALMPCVQSFVQYYYPWTDDVAQNYVIAPYYFVNQIIWLLDSIFYMIGYYVFICQICSSMRARQAEGKKDQIVSPTASAEVHNPIGQADLVDELMRLTTLKSGSASLVLSRTGDQSTRCELFDDVNSNEGRSGASARGVGSALRLTLALFFSVLSVSDSSRVPAVQVKALQDLWTSTTGSGEMSLCYMGWDFRRDPCNPNPWNENVGCSDSKTSIVRLNLTGCALQPSTIPSSLAALTDLTTLSLDQAQFFGPIPKSLFNLTALAYLSLDVNSLTGTIPQEITRLKRLEMINFSSNRLSGKFIPSESFPASWSSTLSGLILGNNQLTGQFSIPLNLRALTVLSISVNLFSGPCPWESFASAPLEYLLLEQNRFTGTLPSKWPTTLKQLTLNTNSFSSTLPTELGTLTSVEYFNAANNHFTGQIPWQMGYCKQLYSLALANNHLTGSGPIPRWPSTVAEPMWPNLRALEVSFNKLEGEFNDQIGSITTLIAIISQRTCFRGSLPSSICQLKSLRSLILVGLSDNEECQYDFGWAKTLAFRSSISTSPEVLMNSSIPGCLFTLPEISTLMLAGNGFSGSLEDIPELSPSLEWIDLSNNILTGPLPLAFQKSPSSLTKLILNANKLTGSWDAAFRVPSGELALAVNRFSGVIPSTFYSIPNATTTLSVLSDNILVCRGTDAEYPPPADPISKSYGCYDTKLMQSFYFCAAALVVMAIAVSVFATLFRQPNASGRKSSAAVEALRNAVTTGLAWYRAGSTYRLHLELSEMGLHQTKMFFSVLEQISKSTGLCLVCVLVFLLPLYPSIKAAHPASKTYEYQYGWVVSAALLRGQTPCQIIWAFLLFFCTILGLSLQRFRKPFTLRQYFIDAFCFCTRSDAAKLFSFASFSSFLLQIVFYGGNIVLVYVVNAKFIEANNSTAYTAVQKELLNVALALFRAIWSIAIVPAALNVVMRTPKNKTLARFVLDAVNGILLPAVSNLMDSKACFHDLLNPSVTTTVLSVYLVPDQIIPTEYEVRLQIPFIYSNACASSMITTFTPTIIFQSIFDGVFRTLFLFGLSSSKRAVVMIPSWLRDLLLARISYEHHHHDVDGKSGNKQPLLDAPTIFSEQLHNLVMLTTYGFASPLLALALGLAVTVQTIVWRMVMGRYIMSISEEGAASTMRAEKLRELDNDVGDTWEVPSEVLSYLIVFCCSFWAFIFFDYVSDDPLMARGSAAPEITSIVTALVSPVGVFVLIAAVKCAQQQPLWKIAVFRLEMLLSRGGSATLPEEGDDVAFGTTPSMKRRGEMAGGAGAKNPIIIDVVDRIPPQGAFVNEAQL